MSAFDSKRVRFASMGLIGGALSCLIALYMHEHGGNLVSINFFLLGLCILGVGFFNDWFELRNTRRRKWLSGLILLVLLVTYPHLLLHISPLWQSRLDLIATLLLTAVWLWPVKQDRTGTRLHA